MPGQTPRHPDGAFDELRGAVHDGMSTAELARTDAWLAGWQCFETGFYWEAHELWEPVWMAAPPNSAEAQLLRGVIALANAGLKRRMGRDRAAARLDRAAEAFLTDAMQRGAAMGLDAARLRSMQAQVRRESIDAI